MTLSIRYVDRTIEAKTFIRVRNIKKKKKPSPKAA